ncbi:MAG: hypothetical protein ABSD56_12280, partial [Bryobacteraceae bacterium]
MCGAVVFSQSSAGIAIKSGMLRLAREVQGITGGGNYDAARTALLELVPDAGKYAGKFVRDANPEVTGDLKSAGMLLF